jgi:oligopeptide/dipeptide ABC transporter ATP-binding protein
MFGLIFPDGETMPTIPGRVPDLQAEWTGCSFAGRCPRAEAVCRASRRPLLEVSPRHRSACHFAGEFVAS